MLIKLRHARNYKCTDAVRAFHEVQQWQLHGKRGIWLRLNLTQAQLINVAVDAGFDFKHAQKGHVIMTKWLSSDVPDLLPDGATHQVRYLV